MPTSSWLHRVGSEAGEGGAREERGRNWEEVGRELEAACGGGWSGDGEAQRRAFVC